MERYEMALRLFRWADEHPQMWKLVYGFKEGDVEENLTAAELLRDAGFYELCLMVTLRACQLTLEQEGDQTVD